MEKIDRIGNIYGFTGGSYAGMVYGIKGLAPALNTMGGGRREPLILEIYDEEDNTAEHDEGRMPQNDLREDGKAIVGELFREA